MVFVNHELWWWCLLNDVWIVLDAKSETEHVLGESVDEDVIMEGNDNGMVIDNCVFFKKLSVCNISYYSSVTSIWYD